MKKFCFLILSFPLATEMFHFTRSSPHSYVLTVQYSLKKSGFPHSEISGSKVAYHLTEAYRRLLRPSSSDSVKASTIRPYYTTKALNRAFIIDLFFAYIIILDSVN